MKHPTPYYVEPRQGDVPHLDLNGSWDFAYFDEPVEKIESIAWDHKATLPASAYWNLYEAQILPHPYEKCNSKLYSFADEKVWYYRRAFSVTQEQKSRGAYLCFDGVSYYARIWLNGTLLGQHEGMFGGPFLRVESLLQDDNVLIVEVKACNYGCKGEWTVFNRNQKQTAIVPWNLARDDSTSNGDFIVFGIWRDVRIEFLSELHLSRPYLVTTSIDEAGAHLHLELEIPTPGMNELENMICEIDRADAYYGFAYANGNSGAMSDVTVTVRTELIDKQTGMLVFCEEDDRTLFDVVKSGQDDRYYECNFFEKDFVLPSPKLWYPNGMGDADLYTCQLTLFYQGTVLDEQRFDTGIRTLRLCRSAGAKHRTRWGNFWFEINGRRIFLKGMNWMPVDFLLKMPREEYRWALDLAKNAGIQLLRCWSGGGIPENNDFYGLCDELGIMVWQDSFIANMVTPLWPQDVLEEQVCLNLYRIRNHPSLAVHCGGNEFNPYEERNTASMAVIERDIADLDPYRPFYRTTPDKGSAHIYIDMEPTWYRARYQQLPFVAESGIHSFPNAKSLRQLLSKEEYFKPLSNIFSEEFREKNPELLNHFTEYVPERIPRMLSRASHICDINGITLTDLIEATQMASYDFYQVMIDAMRENYPVTVGIMPWVFKRAWTTVGIQLVDGLGDPIAPYYAVKNAYSACRPVVSLEHMTYAPGEEMPLRAKVIYDGMDGLKNVWFTLEVMDQDWNKTLIAEKQFSLSNEEYQVSLTDERFVIPNSWADSFFFVRASVSNRAGLISQSFYWVKCLSCLQDEAFCAEFRSKPSPNLYLDKGPWLKDQVRRSKKGALSIAIESLERSGELTVIRFLVQNTTDVPIFPVRFDILEDQTVSMLNDNYFYLDAHAERRMCMTVRQKDKACPCGHLTLAACAWNAESVEQTISL